MKLHHAIILGLTLLGTVPTVEAATGQGQPPTSHHAARSTAAKVHLNKADATQLQSLKGVGPKTAQAIIAFRKKSGPFKSVDQLLAIKGIGPKTLAKMRDRLAL